MRETVIGFIFTSVSQLRESIRLFAKSDSTSERELTQNFKLCAFADR